MPAVIYFPTGLCRCPPSLSPTADAWSPGRAFLLRVQFAFSWRLAEGAPENPKPPKSKPSVEAEACYARAQQLTWRGNDSDSGRPCCFCLTVSRPDFSFPRPQHLRAATSRRCCRANFAPAHSVVPSLTVPAALQDLTRVITWTPLQSRLRPLSTPPQTLQRVDPVGRHSCFSLSPHLAAALKPCHSISTSLVVSSSPPATHLQEFPLSTATSPAPSTPQNPF